MNGLMTKDVHALGLAVYNDKLHRTRELVDWYSDRIFPEDKPGFLPLSIFLEAQCSVNFVVKK